MSLFKASIAAIRQLSQLAHKRPQNAPVEAGAGGRKRLATTTDTIARALRLYELLEFLNVAAAAMTA